MSVYIPGRSCHRQLQSQHPQCATSPPLQHQEAVKPTASTVTPPGFHWEKNGRSEIGKLSLCELGHARMVVVRTRRYFSSWHQAHGSAGRAIAHWRDASTERTIIVVANSSRWFLCAVLKIAFYTKNRITTPNCAQADVTVTSCFCNESVSHIWFSLSHPRVRVNLRSLSPRCHDQLWATDVASLTIC